MSAETTYDPFQGYVNNNAGGGRGRGGGGYNQGGRGGGAGGDREMGANLKAVDWENTKLVPGKWVVFNSKAVAEGATAKAAKASEELGSGLNEEDTVKWRKEHDITIVGNNCPTPMPDFNMLTMLPPFIQQKFAVQGFTAPTAVQAQSWPILFQNRDMVGVAKTGSGKTLSFIVPAIAHISAQDELQHGDGPICVVLAPTRELAQQIEVETKKVLPSTMRCTCVYGGSPKGPQLQQLRMGIHILVATPGRLIDFLEIRRTNLYRCSYFVMDEADRMLDMGFEPQVRSICSQMRPERQSLMFSATWPKEIQKLASQFMRDFIRINVGSTELRANPDVTQHFVFCGEQEKFFNLKKIMTQYARKRMLVFCKTKRTADFLEKQLKGGGITAMALHGDKEQRQREFILDRFRKDSKLVVVATDVAARGLDVKELDVVINYDFPMQIDDYVHRIGRTGRAGAKGDAHTLLTKREDQVTANTVRILCGLVSKAGQTVPPEMEEWARDMSFSNNRGGGRGRRPGYDMFARKGPNPVQYQHANRPSFDASHKPPAQNRQFFGLNNPNPNPNPTISYPPVARRAPPAAAAAAPRAAAPKPFQQPPRKNVTKFDDSDDEGPVKKQRHE